MKTRIYLFFIMLFVFITCSGTVSVLANTQAKFNVSDIPAGNILIYNGWFLASNTYFRGTYDGGQIVIADTYWLSNDGISWTEHHDTPKIIEAADCVVVLGTIKTNGKLDSYHFGSLDGVIDGYSYPLIPFDLPTGVLQTETVYFLYNNSLFCAVPKYHNQDLSVHTTYISSNEQFILYAYDSYTWSLRSSSLLQMNLNSVVYCNGVSVDGYFSVQSLMQSSTAAPSPTPTLSPTPLPSSGDLNLSFQDCIDFVNSDSAFASYRNYNYIFGMSYNSTLSRYTVKFYFTSDSLKYFSLSFSDGVSGIPYGYSSAQLLLPNVSTSYGVTRSFECFYSSSGWVINQIAQYNPYFYFDGFIGWYSVSDKNLLSDVPFEFLPFVYGFWGNYSSPTPTPTPYSFNPTDSPVPSNVPVPVVTQAINLEIPDDVDFSKVSDEFNKMGLYTGWLVAFRMLPDEVQVFFWIAICVGCLWLILRALR